MSSADSERSYRRIATEEAFAPTDLIERYKAQIADGATSDRGFESLMGYFLFNDSPRTTAIVERLQDLGERRIGDMDATGIDTQVVSPRPCRWRRRTTMNWPRPSAAIQIALRALRRSPRRTRRPRPKNSSGPCGSST